MVVVAMVPVKVREYYEVDIGNIYPERVHQESRFLLPGSG
jgi:hypothetical protein